MKLTTPGVPIELMRKYADAVRSEKANTSLVPAAPKNGERRMARAIGSFGVQTAGGYSIYPWQLIINYRTIVFQCCNFIAERFAECTPTVVLKIKQGEKQKHALKIKAFIERDQPHPGDRRFVSKAWKAKAAGPLMPEDDYEKVSDDDPLAALLVRPNVDDFGFSFWYLSGVFFPLAGDVYIYKSRDTARRVESLWLLPTQWMRPVCLGLDKLVDWYECTPMRGTMERYDPADIIRIRRPSPFHPLAAMSATAGNAAEIDTNDQLGAVQNSVLKNQMMFSGVLSAEGGNDPMSPASANAFMSMLQQQYQGLYKSGTPLVLEPGWLWNGIEMPSMLPLTESKQINRKYVIQSYGLDESYFESKEHTDAGVKDMRRKIRDTAIAPMLRWFGEGLTEGLAKEEFGDDYRVVYADDAQESLDDKLKKQKHLSENNRITTNEDRAAFDLEPLDIPEADMLFVEPNLIPLSSAEEAAESTINPPQANAGSEYTDTPLDDGRADDPPSKAFREELRLKDWDESKHPRGQPENAGEFGPGSNKPSGNATKTDIPKSTAVHPGATHKSTVIVKPTKRRAFDGKSPVATKTTLTKQETGRVGEAIAVAYLRQIGYEDAGPMKAAITNYPIDLIEDHRPTEVKAGLCSNSRGAQQWRLTFSKESAAEKTAYEKMSDSQKEKWNAKKQQRIHDRKQAVIKELQKKNPGKKIQPRTLTMVINPDTRTADIYIMDGFHDRIDWQSPMAKDGYKGSVTYG